MEKEVIYKEIYNSIRRRGDYLPESECSEIANELARAIDMVFCGKERESFSSEDVEEITKIVESREIYNLLRQYVNVYKRHSVPWRIPCYEVVSIYRIFGPKFFIPVLKNFLESSIREGESDPEIADVLYSLAFWEGRIVREVLQEIKEAPKKLGKKKLKSLIELVKLINGCIKIEMQENTIKRAVRKRSISEARESLKILLGKEIVKKFGIKKEKLGFVFENISWIIPWIVIVRNREIRRIIVKIINGDCKVEKVGIPKKNLTVKSERGFDQESIKDTLKKYAKDVGCNHLIKKIEGSKDLASFKEIIRYLMSFINKNKSLLKKKGARDYATKEILSNLSRYLNLIEGDIEEFMLVIDPDNLLLQMEALEKIKSCFSPEGTLFEYSLRYLFCPNTFFAIIVRKRDRKVFGRFTIFVGRDEQGNPCLARVSKVYSFAPFDEKFIDKVLEKYCKEINYKFLREGVLYIEGLSDADDDFIEQTEKIDGKLKIYISRKS